MVVVNLWPMADGCGKFMANGKIDVLFSDQRQNVEANFSQLIRMIRHISW
jgi:hypothetical protein